jgi:hypothetical protein
MTQSEAIIIGLQIKATAIHARIAAMQAHDAWATCTDGAHHVENEYWRAEEELLEISNEISRLSSKLSIDPPDVNHIAVR